MSNSLIRLIKWQQSYLRLIKGVIIRRDIPVTLKRYSVNQIIKLHCPFWITSKKTRRHYKTTISMSKLKYCYYLWNRHCQGWKSYDKHEKSQVRLFLYIYWTLSRFSVRRKCILLYNDTNREVITRCIAWGKFLFLFIYNIWTTKKISW